MNGLTQIGPTQWQIDGHDIWVKSGTTEAEVIAILNAPPGEPPLSETKRFYKSKIDVEAEKIRLKYVTPGAGMVMTYQEKFQQAEAVNQIGQAAADALTEAEYVTAYPVLAASVGIEANTLWECAQLVIQKYVGFNVMANAIEKTRLQGKQAIENAADSAGVKAAYEAIIWTV